MRIVIILTALWLLPGTAFGSDPTGLFVLLFGLPAVAAAVISLPISWWAPKLGAAVAGLLLALHLPLVWWAKDVGYLKSAGGWIYLSLSVTAIALMISIARLSRGRPSP